MYASVTSFMAAEIAALLGVRIDRGKHPFIAADGDWGDGIAALFKERIDGGLGVLVAAGVQEWIAEIPQRAAAFAQQLAGHGFAADNVGFIGIDCRRVNVDVRERVVSEFRAGVEPHVEQGGQGLRAQALTDPALIDESGYGDGVRSQ